MGNFYAVKAKKTHLLNFVLSTTRYTKNFLNDRFIAYINSSISFLLSNSWYCLHARNKNSYNWKLMIETQYDNDYTFPTQLFLLNRKRICNNILLMLNNLQIMKIRYSMFATGLH